MGIGEAAVTVLSDRGIPTPVVHTRLAAPAASMGPAPDVDGAAEGVAAVRALRRAARQPERARAARGAADAARRRCRRPPMEHVPVPKQRRSARPRPPAAPDVGDFLRSREGQRLQRKVLRGVFGMLRKRL